MSISILKNRDQYNGLTSSQVDSQRGIFGYNERPKIKKKGWSRRLFGIFTEPMMLLILATAVVYYFIGEKLETILFLCSIVPIGLMAFFQECKTNQAIEVLDKLMIQKVQVSRDGKIITLDSRELVPDDLVYLTAGDKVPADGLLFRSSGLLVDESILTGESIAVTKSQETITGMIAENQLSQGTLVVQGDGYFLVQATGGNTAYGKLGNLLEKISDQQTPLQIKIKKLVKQVAITAVLVSSMLMIILIFTKGWQAGVLGGLTMAMSLVPEEFPVVFSVFLIMGVWRMSKRNALVRQMAMVETLGSATVICTDKTGTLTEGRMALEKVYYQGQIYDITKVERHKVDFTELIRASLLSFEKVAIDPMEIEVQNFADKLKINKAKLYGDHVLVKDLSFDSANKMVHHVWQDKETKICRQYSAGAPESILQSCKILDHDKKKVAQAYEQMAAEGYRVVAVASKDTDNNSEITASQLEFVGLLAMSDPPRAGVSEAVRMCQDAGIRIMMITGDNKLTAHNIAESIGINHNEEIVSGEELENISPLAWQEAVRRHDIFARMRPEQKFLIVEALQNNGEVVAMTGDGVNDAPALKKANIGVAMGQKGTEVARSAAGIILLDDNFSTIVNAVKEGRRIYDNLRQSFAFLFSFHLPIVGLALIPVLFNQPLIFLPIHVIFLELICDPASVLGFEQERARRGLMHEKPRGQNETLINPKLWGKIITQGLVILFISLGFYYYFGVIQNNIILGRTLAFSSLVISQIMSIIFSREYEQVKSNKLLLIISGLTIVVLSTILYIPFLTNLFHFRTISFNQYLAVFFIPFLVMLAISRVFIKRTGRNFLL